MRRRVRELLRAFPVVWVIACLGCGADPGVEQAPAPSYSELPASPQQRDPDDPYFLIDFEMDVYQPIQPYWAYEVKGVPVVLNMQVGQRKEGVDPHLFINAAATCLEFRSLTDANARLRRCDAVDTNSFTYQSFMELGPEESIGMSDTLDLLYQKDLAALGDVVLARVELVWGGGLMTSDWELIRTAENVVLEEALDRVRMRERGGMWPPAAMGEQSLPVRELVGWAPEIRTPVQVPLP